MLTGCGDVCEQLCSGIEENAIGACAQLVFAPMDATVSEDIPLLPSGFRVIPVDNNAVVSNSSPKSNHVIFIPMISYASRV
jgi:hypothetical protein